MAFTNRNIYYGGFVDNFYQYTKPQISMRLMGERNKGGNVGYYRGDTGTCEQTFTTDSTYKDLNISNFMIGICITEGSPEGWYDCYITSNYNMPGQAKGNKYQNYQEGRNPKYFNYNTFGIKINGFFQCGTQPEEIWENNKNHPTGRSSDFYIELTANCPIVELQRVNYDYFYTAKDGTLKHLDGNATISDVAETSILNNRYSEPPKQYIKYYLYNTWTKDDKTTSKKLDAQSEKATSLCLYVDDAVSGEYDTSLYFNSGDTYESVIVTINGVARDFDRIPQNAITYTYRSKFGVYVSQFSTNIPIFDSMQDVNDYLSLKANGDDTNDFIKNNALNPESALDTDDTADSGYGIFETPLNDGYSANPFNKMYSCDFDAIAEISGNLFNTDTSIIDAITQGLKLYGANPMDCIIDLSYYPFDVNSAVSTTSQQQIFFGSYQMTLQNNVNLIGQPRTIIDMGEVLYSPVFNDFRDMEPYSQFYIYLPYCGVHKLDISQYYKKTISLKYIIDFTSGSCIAVLSSDNVIIDTFSGTIGIRQSISSIDYNAYSQNVTRNVVNMVKGGVGTVINGGMAGIGGVTGKEAKGIVGGLIDFEENILLDAPQLINSQRINIRGAGVASGDMCLPQYAFTYCVYNQQVRPKNEREIVGYPSNAGGKVKDFSGFLKCNKVSLNSAATVREKREIYNLLTNGIYIN